jgi:large subunit ribosomal protein L7e
MSCFLFCFFGIEKLKALEDYIAYGYISLKLVEELVHRRAFIFNEEGNKVPLSDNLVVEAALGKYNILCLSDLSHEIYTLGPHFMQAVRFLAPFALSSPIGGFEKKTLHIAADHRRFLGDDMEAFLEKIL